MLADRYGLGLSTASAAARDAYVEGSDLALTFYPGAAEAYDRAIVADPGFALRHAREGPGAAAARRLHGGSGGPGRPPRTWPPVCLSARPVISHSSTFCFAGRTDAAITALYAHLTAWPRDALVVASGANPNGLIGGSGRIGQKHQIAALMDSLAPHYGDDFWFLSYHAMALSEDGQFAVARAKIEQSLAANPNNAHGAHGFAHVCYESGEPDAARTFLSTWLATYPREAFFYGHLSWHLSLCEIEAGEWTRALQLYRDAMALDRHSGGPQQKVSDGAAFLWRSELAGHPRDLAAWHALYDHANSALPRPGNGLADLHVILAQAVMGDDAGLDARARQMEELAREGRYPSGSYLPALACGFVAFERENFSAAIETLAPLAGENERIGGSRAQHDLIEFTLLRSYLSADRLEEARRLISARRPGASGIPVIGLPQ